jgi:hypothetical protein
MQRLIGGLGAIDETGDRVDVADNHWHRLGAFRGRLAGCVGLLVEGLELSVVSHVVSRPFGVKKPRSGGPGFWRPSQPTLRFLNGMTFQS